MITVQILTPWVGSATVLDPYRPQIIDDYQAIRRYTDTTGQPAEQITPAPNLFVAQIECDDATLAQIEADPRFCVLEVEE